LVQTKDVLEKIIRETITDFKDNKKENIYDKDPKFIYFIEKDITSSANTFSQKLKQKDIMFENEQQQVAFKIIQQVVESPLRQMLKNADEPADVIIANVKKRGFGYNIVTRKYCDLLSVGVIDPAKVTRVALQNAASVATTLITTTTPAPSTPSSKLPTTTSSKLPATPTIPSTPTRITDGKMTESPTTMTPTTMKPTDSEKKVIGDYFDLKMSILKNIQELHKLKMQKDKLLNVVSSTPQLVFHNKQTTMDDCIRDEKVKVLQF
jgi:hypothetical protein